MSSKKISSGSPVENKPKALKIIGSYTLTSKILGKGQFGEVVLSHTNLKNPLVADE